MKIGFWTWKSIKLSIAIPLMCSHVSSALRAELGLDEEAFGTAAAKKYETLLEKKWTSIVRLQKKIMDLESRNAALQTELANLTPTALSKRHQDPASWLPRSVRHSLESHRDTINSIAFHPIYSSLASCSDDCTIKIWDWELGELERTVKGHTRAVLDVDYGGPRSSILLASCSSDLSIKLWDPADEYKNIRTLLGHDHSVGAVRFIPSGASGTLSSGNLLVSASRDGTLRIWDVVTGYCVKTLRGHTAWVRDVCPSFDGRFLLSAGDDMTTRLWNISGSNSDHKLTMLGHEHVIECCALAPFASYQYLAALTGLKAPPASSAAEFMATGSRDKTIKLWDAHGRCLGTLIGHDNWVRALAFHPGGKYLLSVSDDKTLRCWDLSQGGKCVKTLKDAHERFITCLRWAPGIFKNVPGVSTRDANGESNGVLNTGLKGDTPDVQVRCVIATGGVDKKLQVFAD
ncbi:nuclear migration protein nudF [Uncinocarpus reesii 1704]|uniref:Nuclear distribution protein PAC1-2 n=1 Tax=Uncinocarpus reesii (strain UAMH 1704) TaxID=336963 RepID=LIS12_UNCRE|nr:nuclear migration protein nudF [Uncinocarpus reesii 1704]C4JPW9.1 RecName: Full=Nuclear distribution protein PAC1-2; AltName: Full=Lissencephaly-1 homolog 2; Short=LIS-1 2; AltName: Full=nudF homolog 2 [Uncinocarpus reesii 1704]EEP79766.1 nuclear migration protein nudF [Uncinocarpus reesii 1704]